VIGAGLRPKSGSIDRVIATTRAELGRRHVAGDTRQQGGQSAEHRALRQDRPVRQCRLQRSDRTRRPRPPASTARCRALCASVKRVNIYVRLLQ